MTIVEKYRTCLVEGDVVPFAPAHTRRKLTDEMNKAHGVFMDVNNTDDDANHNAVKRLCALHDKATPENKKHMEDHIRGKGKEEMRWQLGEHKPDHPLSRAVNQE